MINKNIIVMKKFWIGLMVATILSVAACRDNKVVEIKEDTKDMKPDKTQPIIIEKKQFEANDMQLGRVKTDTFYRKITAQGVLDVPPSHKAVISSYMPGKIKNVRLIAGDKVKKGQLLVQITDPDYIKLQEDYLQAKEDVNFLKQEYERQQQLAKENVVSQKKWQDARRNYLRAKARLNGLIQRLKMLHISIVDVEAGKMTATINLYAPIDGYVSKLYVTEGSAVEEADKIMEIINNEHTHLELRVFEKDIMKLKKGQEISYKVPGMGNRIYKGYVKLIGREIDPDTRSILVHGHLKEPHPSFVAGIYIEAKVHIDKHTGKSVPATAVVKDDDNYYVLKLVAKDAKDYEFEKLPVKVLEEENEKIHIETSVLQSGDTILSKGGFFLVGVEAGSGHSH